LACRPGGAYHDVIHVPLPTDTAMTFRTAHRDCRRATLVAVGVGFPCRGAWLGMDGIAPHG
jgi:hypothetical protein